MSLSNSQRSDRNLGTRCLVSMKDLGNKISRVHEIVSNTRPTAYRLVLFQLALGYSRGSCLEVWNNSVSMTRLGGRASSIDGRDRDNGCLG